MQQSHQSGVTRVDRGPTAVTGSSTMTTGREAGARVRQVQQGLGAMLLPSPELIPVGPLSREGFSAVGWRELRHLAEGASAWAVGDERLSPWVRQAQAHLPEVAGRETLSAWRSCLDDAAPHDAYFRLGRVPAGSEAAGVAYLRALICGLAVFLDEAQTRDEAADYAVMAEALIELWQAALGLPAAAVTAPLQTRELPAMQMRAADPVRRWVRGHQVFAVLTQGLIWTFQQWVRAIEQGDESSQCLGLDRLGRLLHASAAAFRFTADFAPEHYEHTIRPSMSEPQAPRGFSGTLSVDHGHLVRVMSSLREPLAQAKQRWPQAHAAMMAALSQVYDDHKWVCERFDGASVPSLRMSGQVAGPSGVEMLDKFKTRRLNMVG